MADNNPKLGTQDLCKYAGLKLMAYLLPVLLLFACPGNRPGDDTASIYEIQDLAVELSGDGGLGISISPPRDVDGDGCADILVGSSNAAYLLDASSIHNGLQDAQATFVSQAEGTFTFGDTVSFIEDYDGDAVVDIVVAEWIDYPDATVAIFSGAAHGLTDVVDAHLRIQGDSFEYAPWLVVSGATSDTQTPLLVASGTSSDLDGMVWLFSQDLAGDITFDDASATIQGANGSDFGHDAEAVGDVDGDGLDDFFVGAQSLSTDAGTWHGGGYLFRAPVTGNVTYKEAYSTWLGENTGAQIGWAVASAGDVNGDGLEDLLIGGPGYAYVLTEANAGTVNVWQAAAKFKGLEWEHGGKALAAGDLNGDSITDLIMGGDTDSTLAYQAGSVLIVPGPLQGVLEHSDAIKMISTQAGDYLGTSVAAGDLDCDGTSELLVGAPHSNDAGGALFLLDEGLEGLF